MSRVLETLEPKAVFHFFEDLTRIPHGSRNTKAISDYCAAFARARGLWVYQDELNNVIIKKPASAGYETAPAVILQGHLDMVAEKTPESPIDMTKDALALRVEGDYVSADGTTLGGVIVDAGKFDWRASGKFGLIADPNPSYHGVSFVDAAGPAAFATYVRAILLRDQGAAISPFAAFLLLQGTETLSLRLERHAENTKKVVEFLKNHPKVQKVNHPSLPDHPDHALYERYFPNGGASIFTFEIKGGQEAAFRFIDNLEIFSLLANVADVKSLVIHPATTTHAQLTEEELLDQGITPSTIRLSIGTEHIDDILADLEKGFAAV